ncbi:MAG: SagB/ThcOx family dehydrogenase [Xenococcaceae cyanobacterium]
MGVQLQVVFGQFIFGLAAVAQFAATALFGLGQFATGYVAVGQFTLGYHSLATVGLAKYHWSMGTQRKNTDAVMIVPINKRIKLPSPNERGSVSLESALSQRRSVREFSERELTKEEIGQILWAAQGITNSLEGFRTAPSAGALYPLEVYVANKAGFFHYRPQDHTVVRKSHEDVRRQLRQAALDQMPVEEAPCVFVITGIYERTTGKYGERGIRYVHMEAGHVAQNMLLQAVSLGLSGVSVGAFSDREVAQILNLREREKPLYLIPVGQPRID